MEKMWSGKFSWSSVMTPRFLADFMESVREDSKLMLMLCCKEDLALKIKTSTLERLS